MRPVQNEKRSCFHCDLLKTCDRSIRGDRFTFGLENFETEPISISNFSVKTEDGDYLALTGEPEKQEEKLKMEETGTDYSDDYEDGEEA